jgi:uncharacterized membrane protein
MTQWSLNPIFGSYVVVLGVGAALSLMLLVNPRYSQLSVRRRRVLAVLRMLLITVITLAMLRPTLVRTSSTPQSSLLLLLYDESRSMQLPHIAGSASRWVAQHNALRSAESELRQLADDVEVRVYGYADTLDRREVIDGLIRLPDSPSGAQTDIGTALHEAATRELGRAITGVILLGDGAQNAFSPRVGVQRAARELARLDYPLFTVTFGPTGDTTQSRDVAVESLPERYTVFAKSELTIQGMLRIRGYVNRPVPVELVVQGPKGEPSVYGPVQVSVPEDNQVTSAVINLTPQTPGEYKLTLRAMPQAGELVTQNNELTAFLNVLEGGLRVLYAYGDLVGEQRLLRRSLDASPDVQLDTIFIDARNRQRWPISIEESLRKRKYDVLLIENVDTKALAPNEMQRLAERISQGLGFMMIGGFNSFGPGGYYSTPLADVLPIRMGRFEDQSLDPQVPISKDLHWWGELTISPTRSHPVTRLAAGDENANLWQSLPPLLGANRFQLKPASQVLLESHEGRPLLVAGNYGRGRVLAFAGNTTGRWWQYGRQREHRRFWRQSVLWLAQREDLDKNDVWIKMSQRRIPRGAEVEFTAGAYDATGEPLPNATLSARLIRQERSSTVSLARSDEDYRGVIAPVEAPGDYVVEVTATLAGETLGTARASFQILDRDLELSDPSADYALMARLAALTDEAGGRAVAPEELSNLLRELSEQQRSVEVEVQSRWQLGDTALDAWLLFLLVVVLISSEWILRKKWGLV